MSIVKVNRIENLAGTEGFDVGGPMTNTRFRTVASVDINDDAVLAITSAGAYILVINGRSHAYLQTISSLIAVRVGTTPVAQVVAQPGSTVETKNNTVLTGTTGTDGKLTVSPTADTLYIENRIGTAVSIGYTLLGS